MNTLVSLIVVFVLAFYPVPVVFGQETPVDGSETPIEEPIQVEGTDGTDGGEGDNGGDGITPGEGGESDGPPAGDDGEDTGDSPAGDVGGTGGEEESETGDEETVIDTGDADSTGDIANYVDLSILTTLAEVGELHAQGDRRFGLLRGLGGHRGVHLREDLLRYVAAFTRIVLAGGDHLHQGLGRIRLELLLKRREQRLAR